MFQTFPNGSHINVESYSPSFSHSDLLSQMTQLKRRIEEQNKIIDKLKLDDADKTDKLDKLKKQIQILAVSICQPYVQTHLKSSVLPSYRSMHSFQKLIAQKKDEDQSDSEVENMSNILQEVEAEEDLVISPFAWCSKNEESDESQDESSKQMISGKNPSDENGTTILSSTSSSTSKKKGFSSTPPGNNNNNNNNNNNPTSTPTTPTTSTTTSNSNSHKKKGLNNSKSGESKKKVHVKDKIHRRTHVSEIKLRAMSRFKKLMFELNVLEEEKINNTVSQNEEKDEESFVNTKKETFGNSQMETEEDDRFDELEEGTNLVSFPH